MSNTDNDAQESRPQGVGGRNLLNSVAERENLNPPDQDQAESGMATRLPVFPDLISLGSQTSLIELFPMAAYAVRASDGVIAWFNSRAVELWGRVPALGDTDERFRGAYKLYHADGTHMAHCRPLRYPCGPRVRDWHFGTRAGGRHRETQRKPRYGFGA